MARAVVTVAALAFFAFAASPIDDLLLVVNEASTISVRIAEYYARKRDIPDRQILRLRTPPEEEIALSTFRRDIESPIAQWLTKNAARDRIQFVVLTKDMPLRIRGTGGLDGTMASVDSELTLLYRKLGGAVVPEAGRIGNPYFAATGFRGRVPFTHARFDMYLVTRLDGYTIGDVLGIIDRAASPAAGGTVVLDQKGTGIDKTGDQWLEQAAAAVHALGQRVVLERTTALAERTDGVIGYYSWGSNDPAFKRRRVGLSFAPGAIAATFVSSDGRTLREPPASWTIGDWKDKSSFYAGSPQSLIGDLIREGVTGAAAHVGEPYLDATIRPQILFPAYLSGANLAEAFYQAMPYLSWQTIVIGDPLCTLKLAAR